MINEFVDKIIFRGMFVAIILLFFIFRNKITLFIYERFYEWSTIKPKEHSCLWKIGMFKKKTIHIIHRIIIRFKKNE